MTYRSLIYGLWFGGMALQALLGGVLLAKRMWEKFPIFTAYSLVNFLQAVVLYAVRLKPHLYVWTYWAFESLGVVLGLGVVYEIFAHLFSSHPALRTLATRIFWGALVALVLLGSLVVYLETPARQSGLANAIFIVEEAVRILELGLMMFLFFFSSVFGLHWRQSAFGILLGLGIFATVELITVTMLSHVDKSAGQIFSLIRMSAFNLSLLIWIGYILAPERVTAGELPKREQLEQWNQAILELIGQ